MTQQQLCLVLGFGLGACATAATQSIASEEPTPEPTTAATEGAVIPAADAVTKTAPSGKATITILAQGDNAFVGRLAMEAGGAVPEHRDTTEEYIHVLAGTGTITIEGKEHPVAPGTTIYMPANALVSYSNGPAKLVALQVFAGPEPAAKYDAWE